MYITLTLDLTNGACVLSRVRSCLSRPKFAKQFRIVQIISIIRYCAQHFNDKRVLEVTGKQRITSLNRQGRYASDLIHTSYKRMYTVVGMLMFIFFIAGLCVMFVSTAARVIVKATNMSDVNRRFCISHITQHIAEFLPS